MVMDENFKARMMAIYTMAFSDGELGQSELTCLRAMAERHGISEEEIVKILMSPGNSDYIPSSVEERIEWLYDLALMAWADGVIRDEERNLLRRFAMRYDFLEENVEAIIDFLLGQAKEGKHIDEVLQQM